MAITGEYRKDIILTIRTTGTTDWLGNPLSIPMVVAESDIRNAFGLYPQITDSEYASLSDSSFVIRRNDLINTLTGTTLSDVELLKVTSTGFSGILCPIPIPTTTTTTTLSPTTTTTTQPPVPTTTTTTTFSPTTTTTTTASPPVNYTLNANVNIGEDIVVNTSTFKSYKRFVHLTISPTPAAGHSIVLTYDALVIGPPASVDSDGLKVYGVDYTSNQYVSADGTNVASGTVIVEPDGLETINTLTFDTAHPTHEIITYADLSFVVPPINYSISAIAIISSFTSTAFASGSGNIDFTFNNVSYPLPAGGPGSFVS